MNEQQAKAAEYAEILLAFSRGEDVQVLSGPNSRPDCQKWSPVRYPVWDFGANKYRIVPKPVERWAVIDGRGEFWGTYDKEHQAAYSSKDKNGRYFLMREVTE